jgi:hypothetical protein
MTRMLTTVAALIFSTTLCFAQARPTAAAPSGAVGGAPARAAETLTNSTIGTMVRAGLGADVIVLAIEQSPDVQFDLGVAALIEMKKLGAPDGVLTAMQRRAAAAQPQRAERASMSPAKAPAAAPASEIGIEEPGIYVEGLLNGVTTVVQLEPTVFSQAKTGGLLASALTYGIKKVKWNAVVRGAGARLRVAEARPVFYLSFEQRGSGLSHSGPFTGWLSGASSPNEFILARMTGKPTERRLVVGEAGAFGASSGTRSKDTVDFEYTRVRPGLYRVQPTSNLEPGEYCFFYAAGTSIAGNMGKLFDFGVDARR